LKKILLIYPGWTGDYYSIFNPARMFAKKYSVYPPLNLAYLAAIAEDLGYTVKIHDGELNNSNLHNYFNIIEDFKPDIVGLTAYTPSFKLAQDIAEMINNNFSNIKVIIGGVHFSAMNSYGEAFLPDQFDYGFVGKSLVSWKEFLSTGKLSPGMVYRTKSNVISIPGKNDDSIIGNILPARHLLENGKYKRSIKFGVKNFTTIFLSIGCPFKCIFCYNDFQNILYREVHDVVNEMIEINRKYDTTHFVMLDDTLTINREKIIEFCEEIINKKLNITFEGSTRANLIDDELMGIMVKAGLIAIGFGLETADEDIRKTIKKGVKTSSYIEANKLANKYNLVTQNSCIIGLPGETIKTVKNTLLFLRENKDIKQANLSIATPYPGTELYKMAKNGEGGLKLLTEDFTKYKRYGSAVMDSGDLKSKELISIQKEAFASIYIVPWRWKYTIQRSGYLGLLFDLIKISKLIITGKWRFLFTKSLKNEI
jgi:anaerobic magnesium-protoporphyrin IX monomethyl ester cyclase